MHGAWEQENIKYVAGRGAPEKAHMPYGNPFVTKTAHLKMDRFILNQEERVPRAILLEFLHDLKTGNVTVRQEAMQGFRRTLRFADNNEIMEAVLAAVYDEDFRVRWDAAGTMEAIGLKDPAGLDTYVARLAAKIGRNTTTPVMERVLTLEALGRIPDVSFCYSRNMGEQLLHEHWFVRLTAIDTMLRMAPEEQAKWWSVINDLRRDDHEEVRNAAAKALNKQEWKDRYNPGWMKVQKPAWRKRVLANLQGKNRKKR